MRARSSVLVTGALRPQPVRLPHHRGEHSRPGAAQVRRSLSDLASPLGQDRGGLGVHGSWKHGPGFVAAANPLASGPRAAAA